MCDGQTPEVSQTCRVRKEFLTGLTDAERAHYINTVKTAASTEPHKEKYEELLTRHKIFFDDEIHEQIFFLPWHRWFILEYENILREIDSEITVPYWDWSLVADELFTNDFWATDDSGFGGNGNPPGQCVDTGPFREGEFSLIESAGGGCLRRRFRGRAPDAVAVEILLQYTAEEFSDFEVELRTDFHNTIHNNIGATMVSHDAASAPEFFEHHGFVDKIWSDWQKKGDAYKFNTYFMEIDEVMPNTTYLPRDFLDLQNMPGGVCAEYEDPISVVHRDLKGLSLKELQNIPRLRLPDISLQAAELFRVPVSELVRVLKLRKKLEPKRFVQKSELKGLDAKLGFKLSDVKKARAAAKKSGRFDV